MSKFAIMDKTSNTGKDYIGEMNENVELVENAVKYDTFEEANDVKVAIDPTGIWAVIIEIKRDPKNK